MGMIYKIYQLSTKALQPNGVFVGTLKLPKDVDFLSIVGESPYSVPTFCISVSGNSFNTADFINYNFMIIEHYHNQTEIPLNDYHYIGLASLPNEYNSISSMKHYDVFVKQE